MPQALKSPEEFAQELIIKFGKQAVIAVDTIAEFTKNHSNESEFAWDIQKLYFDEVKAIINENI
jgi:hypothetical protein